MKVFLRRGAVLTVALLLPVTFLVSCGMSERKFRDEIEEDVLLLCGEHYTGGYTVYQETARNKSKSPAPPAFSEVLDVYVETLNGDAENIIASTVEEYLQRWQDEAKEILIRSFAASSAYGSFSAYLTYELRGRQALRDTTPPDMMVQRSFARDFLLPHVFDSVYASVLPEHRHLTSNAVRNDELTETFVHWLDLVNAGIAAREHIKALDWIEDNKDSISFSDHSDVRVAFTRTGYNIMNSMKESGEFEDWSRVWFYAFISVYLGKMDRFQDEYRAIKQRASREFLEAYGDAEVRDSILTYFKEKSIERIKGTFTDGNRGQGLSYMVSETGCPPRKLEEARSSMLTEPTPERIEEYRQMIEDAARRNFAILILEEMDGLTSEQAQDLLKKQGTSEIELIVDEQNLLFVLFWQAYGWALVEENELPQVLWELIRP